MLLQTGGPANPTDKHRLAPSRMRERSGLKTEAVWERSTEADLLYIRYWPVAA